MRIWQCSTARDRMRVLTLLLLLPVARLLLLVHGRLAARARALLLQRRWWCTK
jgi:hypothetical protein